MLDGASNDATDFVAVLQRHGATPTLVRRRWFANADLTVPDVRSMKAAA
jgi:hypothetical protein